MAKPMNLDLKCDLLNALRHNPRRALIKAAADGSGLVLSFQPTTQGHGEHEIRFPLPDDWTDSILEELQ